MRPEQDLEDAVACLSMALQPVVSIQTGSCHGFEALIRGTEAAGFSSIQDFLDHWHRLGRLAEVEMALRTKAIAAFASLPGHGTSRLFLNIDNRVLGTEGDPARRTRPILERHGLPESAVVFEISERHPLDGRLDAVATFRHFKRQGFRLAIDDFGTGFSGLQLLYFAEPDYLKIDRFFVADIARDARKKVFLAHIVSIAHLLGAVVVAEGVETEREFQVCREIGCDLAQGWLVARPTTRPEELLGHYPAIAQLARQDRRLPSGDQRLITGQISTPEPLALDTPMERVFERFRADKAASFFPVVDGAGVPAGIVRDKELKDFTYSPFGRELMANKGYGRRLADFIVRCPVADISTRAEQILEAYSAVEGSEGILIADGMRYVGFLSADSLLRVINEKNLAQARDQNPLSRLPGNAMILSWVSEVLEERREGAMLAYFDFDNFKPFNDKYGFRLGDRAILLFAEMLSKAMAAAGGFAGHIGGDDFFAGFKGAAQAHAEAICRRLVAEFARGVESFYDDGARRAGHISGADRQGNIQTFPLMTVSCVLVRIDPGCGTCTTDDLSRLLGAHKKVAKLAAGHVTVVDACG